MVSWINADSSISLGNQSFFIEKFEAFLQSTCTALAEGPIPLCKMHSRKNIETLHASRIIPKIRSRSRKNFTQKSNMGSNHESRINKKNLNHVSREKKIVPITFHEKSIGDPLSSCTASFPVFPHSTTFCSSVKEGFMEYKNRDN